ncbi:MAG: LacI family DNA-binding transcriptional regulator [Actinomycetaceae bacterium]|nr:LacI family DNA-binding transcriptional regulator [Actinomycetaceae bacterium]
MVNNTKAPVIGDVAQMAGVSVSTVSRYLNGSPHIKAETANRIARAITLLGYRPSAVARGLRKSALQIIAVFATNTTLLGSAITIEGIEAAASENGYSVIISKLDPHSSQSNAQAITTVSDLNPAGVIVLKYDLAAVKAIGLLQRGVPTVVIGGEADKDHDQVSLCEHEGGKIITEYLLSLGHKTVHHVGVPVRSRQNSRFDGWSQALWDSGITVPEPLESTWDAQVAANLADRLIALKATAVFAGNDEIAMGLIAGLQRKGKKVPEDISVVGFDNHPLGDIWNPAITTFEQDFCAAGRCSVELLLKRIKAQNEGELLLPSIHEIPGRLVIRDSARKV